MDLNQKYAIDEKNVSWRTLADQMMIINLDNGFTYNLNESGARIWEGINKERSLGNILNSLKAVYRLPEKKLREDLVRLIRRLEKAKLVMRAAACSTK